MPIHNLQEGVSAIELMVTVAIIGVIAAIAIPSYQDYIARERLVGAAQAVYGKAQIARREAISNNDTRYLKIVEDSGSWCVFVTESSTDECSDVSLYAHGRDFPDVVYETTSNTFEFSMPSMISNEGIVSLSNASGIERISIGSGLQVSLE